MVCVATAKIKEYYIGMAKDCLAMCRNKQANRTQAHKLLLHLKVEPCLYFKPLEPTKPVEPLKPLEP